MIESRLEEVMKEKRFSERKLAEVTGLSRGTIRNCKNNIGSAKLVTLKAIADGMGMKIKSFIRIVI